MTKKLYMKKKEIGPFAAGGKFAKKGGDKTAPSGTEKTGSDAKKVEMITNPKLDIKKTDEGKDATATDGADELQIVESGRESDAI